MGSKTKKVKKQPISAHANAATIVNVHDAHKQSESSLLASSAQSSFPKRARPAKRTAVSRKLTQSTIARFHTLLKQQARLKSSLRSSHSQQDANVHKSAEKELKAIEQEMESLGGLNAYQIASTLGQSNERGGDSSKVLVRWLVELGLRDQAETINTKLRMLEIGALIPTNYASCSRWIANQPIDLHSQHPDILEQDFFQRPLPVTDINAFDIVSCSLVLNFVSSPSERGRMLSLIRQQLKPLPTQSFLFLVLPLPCLTNSRYLTLTSFQELMRTVGFSLEKEQWKPGGKVGYWLWRKSERAEQGETWRKKSVIDDGPKKNNFAVVLP